MRLPRLSNKERTISSKNDSGTTVYPHVKNKVQLLPHTTYKKKNPKQINDLNRRDKTIKLLEENKGVNLHDIGS